MATSTFSITVVVGSRDYFVSLITTHWVPGVGTGHPHGVTHQWCNDTDLERVLLTQLKGLLGLAQAEHAALQDPPPPPGGRPGVPLGGP